MPIKSRGNLGTNFSFKIILNSILGSTAISYGKLKIGLLPSRTLSPLLLGRSSVVATRQSSFLNNDGDVFKLFKPALLIGAPRDSISFESLRFPGSFLRLKADKGKYGFRVEKPVDGDNNFSEYQM